MFLPDSCTPDNILTHLTTFAQWSQRVVDADIKHNSVSFQARSPKFCMEVDLDLQPTSL